MAKEEQLKERNKETPVRDYSLLGEESLLAVQKGLADATWYASPVSHEDMKELLVRKNGPAIRDTILWFTLIIGSGVLFYLSWGNWWAIFPYVVYTVLYGSTSDSRWHESSHGTAFRSDWMNNVLYEISSFMVFRQSVPWRWSHTRHHSDTIIRGRDPEIAVQRPPNRFMRFLQHFAIPSTVAETRKILLHASGKIDPEVATFLPESEYKKVFLRARIYLLIYLSVIALAIFSKSILPLFFIGFPTFLGAWLMVIYGTTQHAGLAENVLDHRLNCRTVYMNRIHRYLYWNMNYHVEHHMFPLVPYHALPKLHQLIKDDCPQPYSSIINAYKEIIPAIIKQTKDPEYYVKRVLPEGAGTVSDSSRSGIFVGREDQMKDGWIEVCSIDDLAPGDVIQFDFQEHTYAVYRTEDNSYYATDGICTHGNMHLAKGLVIGDQIECAKHNGRFSLVDGSVKRAPVCIALKTFKVKVEDGKIWMEIASSGNIPEEEYYYFRVVESRNIATFIRELVLQNESGTNFKYRPGEYCQIEIPKYETSLSNIQIDPQYKKEWRDKGIHRFYVKNITLTRRNYSMATNPDAEKELIFNVRLSLPPEGTNLSPGLGSSYVFGLKPGDTVKLSGPYGDFHIKETAKEMVYIGGGAGMAPIRSHISNLFDSLHTERKVSFWYGARSKRELLYSDYFIKLADSNENFEFNVALSEPDQEDPEEFHSGLIHEIVEKEYLQKNQDPGKAEYYLCGPPAMISACLEMLDSYNVPKENIAFDEF